MQKFNMLIDEQLFKMSLLIAQDQIGVQEVGHNEGTEVELYLKSVGLAKGNPYCAAGQYYCFDEAAKELELPSESIPLPRSGLAKAYYNYAKKHGWELNDTTPQIGDLIVWIKPNGINGHIERIIDVLSKKQIMTIAFNTMNAAEGDQREGEGVFTRSRDISRNLGNMKPLGLIGFEFID